MSEYFFESLIILTIIIITVGLIKIVIPLWRFLERADAVIKLYGGFKAILKKDLSKVSKIELSYGKYGKYKMEFNNISEACKEFENLVNEALIYYNELIWLETLSNCCKIYKDEIIKICTEVRLLSWQKQGI